MVIFRHNEWFALIFLLCTTFALFLYTLFFRKLTGYAPCNAFRPWLWKGGAITRLCLPATHLNIGAYLGVSWTCFAILIGLGGRNDSDQTANQQKAFILWVVGLGVEFFALMFGLNLQCTMLSHISQRAFRVLRIAV